MTLDGVQVRLGKGLAAEETQFLGHVEVNCKIVQFDNSVHVRDFLDGAFRVGLKYIEGKI
jgi:hypothetical protein